MNYHDCAIYSVVDFWIEKSWIYFIFHPLKIKISQFYLLSGVKVSLYITKLIISYY